MAAPSSLSNTISNSKYAVSKVSNVAQNNGTLSMQQFMVLLTTELQNQDPTQPMDDATFFGQMAQLDTAQGMQTLTQQSQVQEAQSLMGQVVTATIPYTPGQSLTNNTVTGTVTSLASIQGVYNIGIQDSTGTITQVPLSNITNVSAGVTGVTNPAALIGSYVSGPVFGSTTATGAAATSDTGQVLGVSVVNGQTLLEVKDSSGNTVQMDPNTVTAVASQ